MPRNGYCSARVFPKNSTRELYPLSHFVTYLYPGRSDIQCIPNLDNRDFDARILDYSISPPSELKVEITSAVDGHDQHLRMQHLVRHGRVNLWGRLSALGTEKRGHEIHVENEGIEEEPLERACPLIRSAAKRKAIRPNKPRKYGRGHVLLIAFDDWLWFDAAQHMEALKDFVNKQVLTLPLNFAALYVVGLSGETCVHFALPKI